MLQNEKMTLYVYPVRSTIEEAKSRLEAYATILESISSDIDYKRRAIEDNRKEAENAFEAMKTDDYVYSEKEVCNDYYVGRYFRMMSELSVLEDAYKKIESLALSGK